MDFEQEFNRMMSTFKNDVFEAFEEEFGKVVETSMVDAVEEVVYKKYNPQKYVRRRTATGGLQNKESIKPEFEYGDSEIVAKVKNKATWRDNANRKDNLDEAIVEGTMFPKSHMNYKTLKRPFYDDPQDGVLKRIQNSEKEMDKRIRDKMIKNGWG